MSAVYAAPFSSVRCSWVMPSVEFFSSTGGFGATGCTGGCGFSVFSVFENDTPMELKIFVNSSSVNSILSPGLTTKLLCHPAFVLSVPPPKIDF